MALYQDGAAMMNTVMIRLPMEPRGAGCCAAVTGAAHRLLC